jgi:hypothetical protein
MRLRVKPLKPEIMNYELEMEPSLLDERYDEGIMENLMYVDFNGNIKDSGKSGDKRIYDLLRYMEKEKGVKL